MIFPTGKRDSESKYTSYTQMPCPILGYKIPPLNRFWWRKMKAEFIFQNFLLAISHNMRHFTGLSPDGLLQTWAHTELTQLPVFPAHTQNLSALKDSTAAQTRTLPGLGTNSWTMEN